MRSILISITALIVLLSPTVLASGQALAVDVFQPCSGNAAGSDVCNDANAQSGNSGNNNPIIGIIKAAINILSFIVGIGAVIGIVVSGFRIITAGGDSQAVATARSALVYSLAGLAVAILAQALVVFVLDRLG